MTSAIGARSPPSGRRRRRAARNARLGILRRRSRSSLGVASGTPDFTIGCQVDATTTSPGECLRVTWGIAPSVSLSSYDAKEYKYEDVVKYSCQKDDSVTGMIAGAAEFEIAGQEDGTYEDRDSCNSIQLVASQRPAPWSDLHVPAHLQLPVLDQILRRRRRNGGRFHPSCQADGEFKGIGGSTSGCSAAMRPALSMLNQSHPQRCTLTRRALSGNVRLDTRSPAGR